MTLVEKILRENGKDLTAFVDAVKSLMNTFRSDGNTIEIDFLGSHYNENYIYLSLIKVVDKRKGHGTKFMEKLCDLCDQFEVPITLSPATEFGTPKAGLMRFYKQFHFQTNSSSNRTNGFKGTMIRYPD